MTDETIYIEIQKHCGDVAARIRACRSRSVAEALKERLCSEVNTLCVSPVVHNMLMRHVDNIIEETFIAQGKNRYLEDS